MLNAAGSDWVSRGIYGPPYATAGMGQADTRHPAACNYLDAVHSLTGQGEKAGWSEAQWGATLTPRVKLTASGRFLKADQMLRVQHRAWQASKRHGRNI